MGDQYWRGSHQDKGPPQATPKYQVLEVNMGKQNKWGEIATLVVATSTIQKIIEKEHKTKVEVKAQLRQYKQLIMEIEKSLDSRIDDTLLSTSSLPQGDIKALYEMRKVATIVKTWAQDQLGKIKLFLQDIMEVFEEAHFD